MSSCQGFFFLQFGVFRNLLYRPHRPGQSKRQGGGTGGTPVPRPAEEAGGGTPKTDALLMASLILDLDGKGDMCYFHEHPNR